MRRWRSYYSQPKDDPQEDTTIDPDAKDLGAIIGKAISDHLESIEEMIGIPDQVTIGGYEYAIELVQSNYLESDGEVRCRELLIRIDREMAQRRQLGTLLHEIVHAVSDDVLREGKAESN